MNARETPNLETPVSRTTEDGAAPCQYLRINDVCRLLRISKPTLWRLRQRADFPAPTQLSDRAIGWSRADLESWLEARRRRR